MNIMLLGAGGQVGNALARQILETEHTLLAVSRRGDLPEQLLPFVAKADRATPDQVRALIEAHKIDILIDLVAYTEAETAALLAAIDGHVSRYVGLSSGDVYRNYGLMTRLETGTPDPEALDETAALRKALYPYRADTPRDADDPRKWMDAYDKILVEALIKNMTTDWTICRLPMIYGPDDPQMRFAWAISPVKAGLDELVLPAGWLDWTTTYGFAENIAAGILSAALHSDAVGQVFNMVDAPARAHRAWFEEIARLAGWQGQLVETEDPDHPIAQATAALDLSVPLRLSGTHLKALTGYVPPVSTEAAIRQMLDAG